MNSKIIISNTIEELSEKFAQILLEDSYNKSCKFNLALSGGSTPKAVFDYLSDNYKTKIDWNKINFFWGDERCVPSDHPDSNYFMTREHLFNKIEVPTKNIFRIDGDNNPQLEAKKYSDDILKNVPRKNSIPSFDLIILGLGEDGHTASIFPNSINLIDNKNICDVSQHPSLCQKRITLTGTVINNAEKIIFLVTGARKSIITDKIINKKEGFEKCPAALIQPVDGELIWMLDNDSSRQLKLISQ